MRRRLRRVVQPSALGGFAPAMGVTLAYLALIVLIPLAALALRPWESGIDGVWRTVSDPPGCSCASLSPAAA